MGVVDQGGVGPIAAADANDIRRRSGSAPFDEIAVERRDKFAAGEVAGYAEDGYHSGLVCSSSDPGRGFRYAPLTLRIGGYSSVNLRIATNLGRRAQDDMELESPLEMVE